MVVRILVAAAVEDVHQPFIAPVAVDDLQRLRLHFDGEQAPRLGPAVLHPPVRRDGLQIAKVNDVDADQVERQHEEVRGPAAVVADSAQLVERERPLARLLLLHTEAPEGVAVSLDLFRLDQMVEYRPERAHHDGHAVGLIGLAKVRVEVAEPGVVHILHRESVEVGIRADGGECPLVDGPVARGLKQLHLRREAVAAQQLCALAAPVQRPLHGLLQAVDRVGARASDVEQRPLHLQLLIAEQLVEQ